MSKTETARKMLIEDLYFDPSYARQREVASQLIGALLNRIRYISSKPEDVEVANAAQYSAEAFGLITFDDMHHAPMCRANHYHRKKMPTGSCTCGTTRVMKHG